MSTSSPENSPLISKALEQLRGLRRNIKIIFPVPPLAFAGAVVFFQWFEPNWYKDPFMILILALFAMDQALTLIHLLKIRRGSIKTKAVLETLLHAWPGEPKSISEQLNKLPNGHMRDLLLRWFEMAQNRELEGMNYLMDNSANRRVHSDQKMLNVHITLNRTTLKMGFLGTLIGLLMTFEPMKQAILALRDVDGEMRFVSDIAGAIDGDQYAILTTLIATGLSVLIEILTMQGLERMMSRFETVNQWLDDWNVTELRPWIVRKQKSESPWHSVESSRVKLEEMMLEIHTQMRKHLAMIAKTMQASNTTLAELQASQDEISKRVDRLNAFESDYRKFIKAKNLSQLPPEESEAL